MTTRKATKKTEEKTADVDIIDVHRGIVEVCVLGRSPLICNRMSEKAKRTLLLPPPGKMNSAEKATNLKHDPLQEFRDSPYRDFGKGPTRLQALGVWFKKGMMATALDVPQLKKTQIGRWVYVQDDRVPLYGIPQIFLAVVRNSDMNRTPDIRTRAILPRWACRFKIIFNMPLFNQGKTIKLQMAAGFMAGAGDWRVEKGGSYGQYEVVSPTDPEFLSVLEEGREAQDQALLSPISYDDETQSLLTWYDEELARRSQKREVSIVAA